MIYNSNSCSQSVIVFSTSKMALLVCLLEVNIYFFLISFISALPVNILDQSADTLTCSPDIRSGIKRCKKKFDLNVSKNFTINRQNSGCCSLFQFYSCLQTEARTNCDRASAQKLVTYFKNISEDASKNCHQYDNFFDKLKCKNLIEYQAFTFWENVLIGLIVFSPFICFCIQFLCLFLMALTGNLPPSEAEKDKMDLRVKKALIDYLQRH